MSSRRTWRTSSMRSRTVISRCRRCFTASGHDFEKTLEHAEKTVEKSAYELPVEETDIICEKCGARMVVKNGRYGKFAACPNYPACQEHEAALKGRKGRRGQGRRDRHGLREVRQHRWFSEPADTAASTPARSIRSARTRSRSRRR